MFQLYPMNPNKFNLLTCHYENIKQVRELCHEHEERILHAYGYEEGAIDGEERETS